MDLPYLAEYAKSGRASCRGCKSPIAKDTLRLAVMVQSHIFDGKTTQWYHDRCFFVKQRPKTVDDISHFESLRWEDQESIRKRIGTGDSIVVPQKKGKKRDAETAANNKAALKDFVVEYSKSSRAECRGCGHKIMKDEIRVSKKDFETEVGKRYGGQDMWHHLTCFAKLRSELGYFESGDKLPGLNGLSTEDKNQVKTQLPAIKQEEISIKKPKVEDEVDSGESSVNEEIKSQNKTMFDYRDQLKVLKKPELQHLMEYNKEEIPAGPEAILDRLVDVMTFGALQRCKECKTGQFVFDKLGYICQGDLTEWTKCQTITKEPKRRPFKVPSALAEKYTFLKEYKYVPRTRVIRDVNPTVPQFLIKPEKEEDEENAGPKIVRQGPPLYNMEFVIVGKFEGTKDELKKKIARLGGKVVTKISKSVMAVISTAEEVEKKGARIREAETAEVHVVPEDFFDEAKEYFDRIPELVIKKSICSWGTDPNRRLPPKPSSSKSKSGRMFVSSKPSKITLKLKNGGAVDPDSGLEDRTHIYQDRDEKYTAVLGITNIQEQKNSYYKLQLLQADSGNKFWLFRSWGRIGTSIGGNKLEELSLHKAKQRFHFLYKDKSGNEWGDRSNFVKVPGCMYPIDLDYGEDSADVKLDVTNSESKLAKPIQKLLQLIFDVDLMKKVMLEFELDTEKMPLGKLSKSQLQNAYGVLSELQKLVETGGSLPHFIDASNRFYTFVPHSFGIKDPPIINDLDTIKKKIEMVENLMEMEIAYSMMKSTGNNNTIDGHYQQLKTDLDVLKCEADEFEVISEYVKNTHAETHSNYELEIEDVFTVKRQGEEKRYKPFRKLKNRKLLWHGSRTTNLAGILSQGLRIAPPEAPVTGYMFGKGIYFADMVSKSANYCCTSPNNNTGILLLCEVALGDMYELQQAKYVEKLPKGKHSVKGVGRTEPDPECVKELPGGVHVPLGKGVQLNKSKATSLLYNEYIVYDVAQVCSKKQFFPVLVLIRMLFNEICKY